MLIAKLLFILTFQNAALASPFISAVQMQDPYESQLQSALKASPLDQKKSLVALSRIIKSETIFALQDSAKEIYLENIPEFCFALGQMYNISEVDSGENLSLEVRKLAVELAREKDLLGDNSGRCLEAVAKLAPREDDLTFEKLLMSQDMSLLRSSSIPVLIRSLVERRMATYYLDEKNRYFLGDELKKFLRSKSFQNSQNPQIRLAYTQSIWLANDSLTSGDYAPLLVDTDPEIRMEAAQRIATFDQLKIENLLGLLRDSDHRVIIQSLMTLSKSKEMKKIVYEQHSYLKNHARFQVRKAYLNLTEDEMTEQEYIPFLGDASKTVRQLAYKKYLKKMSGDKMAFALNVLSSQDLAAKYGVIESEAGFTQQELATLYKKALTVADKNFSYKVLELIHTRKVLDLYPILVSKRASPFFSEKYPALVAVLQIPHQFEKEEYLTEIYRSSLTNEGFYIRMSIIDALQTSNLSSERELLKRLYSLEPLSYLANRMNKALVQWGLEKPFHHPERWEQSLSSLTPTGSRPIISIQTNKNKMLFELNAEASPLHIREILSAIKKGEWNDLYFHRVEDEFVIQSSLPNRRADLPTYNIRAEINGDEHLRGTIAIPRWDFISSASTGGFFVNLANNWNLNSSYTIIGKLISDDSALDEIEVGDFMTSATVIVD